MPYVQAQVFMPACIEVYKYFTGRLNKKIINSPAKNKTPLNQLRYQDKVAERICRWKLNTNFTCGDLWVTFRYPPRQKVSTEKARSDIKRFLAKLRYLYKKNGNQLKYIYSAGRTKQGMIHFHFVLNRFNTEAISKLWWEIAGTDNFPCPAVHIRHLDSTGNYKKIAAYLIKNSQETFYSNDKIHDKRFCASQKLLMPIIKKKICGAKIWKHIPKAIKGYVLDKDSFYDGYGWSDAGKQWEGCRIQRYTFIRLETEKEKRGRIRKRKIPDIPIIDNLL